MLRAWVTEGAASLSWVTCVGAPSGPVRMRGPAEKSLATVATSLASGVSATLPSAAIRVAWAPQPGVKAKLAGSTLPRLVLSPISAVAKRPARVQASEVKVPLKPGVRLAGVPPAKGTA